MINDSLLLEEAKNKNDDALNYLLKECENIIKRIIKKYLVLSKRIGYEYNDLYQESLISFIKAINTYDEEKNANFKTYVYKIIDNDIKNIINKNMILKYLPLNNAFSLDEKKEGYEEDLYNKINDESLRPIEETIIKENTEEIKKSLTSNELKIYELKQENKTNKEISTILNISIKTIENTCFRIKKKITKIKYF